LTGSTQRDYVSEKEVVINGQKAWLVKRNTHITVTQGEKTLFSGSTREYSKWLRTDPLKKKPTKTVAKKKTTKASKKTK
jgi:hypothetical protein